MADLFVLLLPAVLFLPVGFLLLREVIWPGVTDDGRRLPRIVPLLMFLILLAMISSWVFVTIGHIIPQ